ncbi:guanitoxin biosynthesis heme-dependent pre-guanitoxin N-hydroxylase GntA [Erythrobacter aureus]|uniref:guanitoxin biosynthesis heme-dependent pre-guanitoxin N-hydroxylase GntA n=1 Tax=Erythrobacter aureus TaxID=2182384 RepID=UPI003A95D511
MKHPNLLDRDHIENREKDLEQALQTMIRDVEFPCVGAKSALARGNLKVVGAHRLDSNWDDLILHRELLEWARRYRADRQGLRSLALIFEGPDDLSESRFEQLMWERIQSMADKDAWLGQPYDHRVSSDPSDPHFSLSFGGEAFFVVGLHPNSSRPARRSQHPTLVFNLHDQFERLREEGRYQRMREAILERDKKLAGDINPMLAAHGEASEARQYSGRAVDSDWACPFHDPRA